MNIVEFSSVNEHNYNYDFIVILLFMAVICLPLGQYDSRVRLVLEHYFEELKRIHLTLRINRFVCYMFLNFDGTSLRASGEYSIYTETN